jgi:DNA-binding MarR family transcriptional regulator
MADDNLARMNTAHVRKPRPAAKVSPAPGPAIDLDRYTPAYFTFIANKLARGASAHYLQTYGVGIESWRILVMLAIEPRVTAQQVVQLVGMDKASVSRAFKSMHAQGLIHFSSDAKDGRLRHASFTPKGRMLHDRIMRFALMREQVLLSVLSGEETETLRGLLRRLHANLPAVEAASDVFMVEERAALGLSAGKKASRSKTSITRSTSAHRAN